MDKSSWEGFLTSRQVVISYLILLKLAVWEISLADVKWEATRGEGTMQSVEAMSEQK